jgi:O-antigen ligase
VPHAHDVPLQTLAELGISGAIVGAFLIACVGALLWTALRRGHGDDRWLA